MARKGKENIWNDAINRKNEEAIKQREASEFFAETKPKKDNKEEKVIPVKNVVRKEIVETETVKFTSKKPFTNESGRETVNSHNQVIELESYGDQKSKKKWTIFGVIFSALLMAIIIIPLVIVAAGAALIVDSALTMQELIGYKINETKFSVKHEESGMYLQPPTYEGEQLILGQEETNNFMFIDGDYDETIITTPEIRIANHDDMWLKSDMIFNGHEMKASIVDGKIAWTGTAGDSSIYLKKDENGRNRFSISLTNEKAYVAKDKDSNRIVLSKNPDWFSFETEVSFITTSSEYLNDYKELNEGLNGYMDDLGLGSEGNAISLYSIESGLYLNSYKEIEHDVLPFFLTEEDEYENSLSLSKETDTNLFIQNNNLGEMAFGAYQTLPFDRYATDEWQKYYPILSANDDGTISLKSYDLSKYSDLSMETTDISNAQFWLLPNPHNLREKAIYFPMVGKFLNTKNGILELQEATNIEDIDSLDYFIITHSPRKNPENIEVRKTPSFGGVKENIVPIAEDPEAIDGFEFYGYGYENYFDTTSNPTNYFTEVREKTNCSKKKNPIKLRHLEERTTYQGVVATYRNNDAGVGKHVTFTYVPPFTTGDIGIDWPGGWPHLPNIDWPNIDWPNINWPWTEIIDPGDPIIDGGKGDSATIEIWDSTDEMNSKDENFDIPVNEMLTSASNKIEVAFIVTQGTQDGVTKDVGIRLQETDAAGNIVDGGYDQEITLGMKPEDGEEYTLIFEGLTPETNYVATAYFYDGKTGFEQIQSSPLELDHGESQMKLTTERVVPTFIPEETSYTWDADGAGFSVYTIGNDLRPTDQLQVRLENNTDNKVETTGWIAVSDWATASVPNWTFSVNSRVDGTYYEATCSNAIVLDSYDVNMWVKMDTTTDFIGWDENSPAFDLNYPAITGDSGFDVIEILNMVGITAGKKHIIK